MAGPHGPIALRLYRPQRRVTRPPVLVYFHGGGWTIGDLDTHDVLCRHSRTAPAARWSAVDYRLGARAPFPGRGRRRAGGHALGPRTRPTLGVDRDAPRASAATAPAATSPRWSRCCCATPAGRRRVPVADLPGHRHALRRAVAPRPTARATCSTTRRIDVVLRQLPRRPGRQWADWRASPLLRRRPRAACRRRS